MDPERDCEFAAAVVQLEGKKFKIFIKKIFL